MLRLHYVEGMTTERLAGLFQVSRRTIVRRIREASDALLEGVHAELRRTLKASVTELAEPFNQRRGWL